MTMSVVEDTAGGMVEDWVILCYCHYLTCYEVTHLLGIEHDFGGHHRHMAALNCSYYDSADSGIGGDGDSD